MQKVSKKSCVKIILMLILVVLAIGVLINVLGNKTEEVKNETNTEGVTGKEYLWTKIKGNDEVEDYKYNFDLVLNTEKMTMDGALDFTYYNNNKDEIDQLVFYLYANSYEKEEYRAIDEEQKGLGYPNGFSSGYISIKSVDIMGGGEYEITGSQNHLLIINLDSEVQPEKSTEIKIEYTVKIPNSYGRFGYGEDTISIVNCNPIMAVYDEEKGYYDYEYNNIGDPFFSECADYNAKITVPTGYTIAPTGTITSIHSSKETATYTVEGENRRDFGFVASNMFSVLSKEINGVTVNSYSFSSEKINEKALDAAVNAIDIFSAKFGEYPYETFNVVETNFYIGGMEYPGMVLIDDSYYNNKDKNIMEMIIVHEAAHQWWYAQVGNDQIAEPWLDEALATFSERVYYENAYPKVYEKMIFDYVDLNYLRYNKYMERSNTRIDLNTLEYGDEYSLVVYGFGGWMLNDLREELGAEDFYKAINSYLENNLFQIADREDLEQAIEDITGEDITWWFDKNLQIQVGH